MNTQAPSPASATQLGAKLFRGLADPVRLGILQALIPGEQRVTDLVQTVGSSQGNVSGHLSCLKDCGLVVDRPVGRQVFYRIAADDVLQLLRVAETLLASTGYQVDLCPNYEAEA